MLKTFDVAHLAPDREFVHPQPSADKSKRALNALQPPFDRALNALVEFSFAHGRQAGLTVMPLVAGKVTGTGV